MSTRLEVRGLHAYYGRREALTDVNLTLGERAVTALIGPSGCGKSTFLRTLNRLHETVPGARVSGSVRFGDTELYDRAVDPVLVRRRIGMVFQRANPFPTFSIRDNVLAGAKLNRRRLPRREADDLVERSLRGAHLWEEVKDRLSSGGSSLSGGQQQRLCIARAIACAPDVLLMDEPCSALDPVATLAVEELIGELRRDYTVVIVTHNMQQAARVSDRTAFFGLDPSSGGGRLVEEAETSVLFSSPREKSTEDYVAGRFG